METTRSDLGVPGSASTEGANHANGEQPAIASQPVISRRAVIGGGLAGLGGLLVFPSQLLAKAAVPERFFRRPAEGALPAGECMGRTSASPWWT